MIAVLVADDDKPFAEYVTNLVNTREPLHVVATCHDGAEAIAAYDKLEPAAVIVDLAMPVMDGLQVVKHIRAHSEQTLVIILTGSGAPIDQANAIKAGADLVITKDDFRETLTLLEHLELGRTP